MIKRSEIGLTSLSVVAAFVAATSPSTSRGEQSKHEPHQQGPSRTTDAHPCADTTGVREGRCTA